MAIGSRVPGRDVIAGQYGFLEQARTLIEFSQEVQEVEPARTLIEFEQDVREIESARTLINFQQQVLAPGQTPETTTPPPAYVTINDQNVTGMTARDTVQITFNEGQSATASIFLFIEVGAAINIPSFHGKSIRIETHTDPSDINSEIIPLFTGWIESARHDRRRMGIDIQATDLRSERLSRKYAEGPAPSWASYSKYVQGEPESKNLWSTYLDSYSGSIGYNKAGEFYQWEWDVEGAVADLTLGDADVSYENLTTEFMTRSSVINEMTIEARYRWSKLWTVRTTVDAYNPRNPSGRAFDRSILLQKVENLGEWDLTDYTFYNLERSNCGFVPGSDAVCIDLIWTSIGRTTYSQGIRADLVRRVAQPISEEYTVAITSPESIDAYGETINGGTISFAMDNNYDGSYWETGIRERSNFNPEAVYKPLYQGCADALRDDLPSAFNAAYAKARRTITESHRRNYASCVIHRIIDAELGQVVQHDNRILNVKAQLVGLTYTIADGIRDTELKAAFCYLDTATTATNDFTAPTRPAFGITTGQVSSSAAYNTTNAVFDLTIADIPEYITDENELEKEASGTVKVNKTPVTLINGY